MDEVEAARRRLKRLGDGFLVKIFDKPGNQVSGEDALKIFNTLGMPLMFLIFMADSHGKSIDTEEFSKLEAEQIAVMSRFVQCFGEN